MTTRSPACSTRNNCVIKPIQLGQGHETNKGTGSNKSERLVKQKGNKYENELIYIIPNIKQNSKISKI